jgi:pimeloyl-ACP methyl ester carboxylesterase
MKIHCLVLLVLVALRTSAQTDTLSITLENVPYPHPVKFISISVGNEDLRMAYMDVKPRAANGRTVVLFHGKNFAGYYWKDVISALSAGGYRVIVPDQIGFGKSSKPFIHYSFHALAAYTKQILDSLGIKKASLLGHSMGGMLATRFALLYPATTEKLLLENPIGLEDYRTFVPYITTEQQYRTELKTTAASVKNYYQSSYFPQWKPEYDYLVRIGAGVTGSADFPRYAKVSAMTFTMIYEQPVIYELENLKVPVVLFNGLEDRTIVGKALLSQEEQSRHGQYRQLAKAAAARIRGAKLIEFEGVGHIPHVQIPRQFIDSLLANL